LFHARGPAATKERSPNDDRVRGTAMVIDSADLRPALALAAADGVRHRTNNDVQLCTALTPCAA